MGTVNDLRSSLKGDLGWSVGDREHHVVRHSVDF
jgi:hypothetical protein